MTASMSGMVEFKDKSVLKHWMADLSSDKYANAKIDRESLQDKIEFSDIKGEGV